MARYEVVVKGCSCWARGAQGPDAVTRSTRQGTGRTGSFVRLMVSPRMMLTNQEHCRRWGARESVRCHFSSTLVRVGWSLQTTHWALAGPGVVCDEALRLRILSLEVEGEYCNLDDYYSKQVLSDSRASPIGNTSISEEFLLRPHLHLTSTPLLNTCSRHIALCPCPPS